MGESHHQQATTSSRLGMVRTVGGGEIIEVQGGHIVRSTGRKDRHSKVCTAKGPRDRRVRLSAHTAIQFYDVQDRLGYDRPSKAVDWLIKKAKAAIDELAERPAWNPNTNTNTNTNACSSTQNRNAQQEEGHISEKSEDHIISVHRETTVDGSIIASGSRRSAAATMVGGGGRISTQFPQQLGHDNNNNKYNSGGFLPPALDTDIADTIKSFFPMVAAAETTTSFHNYPPPPDLLSRTTSSTSNQNHQDLRLSLQSFQDPILLHHHQQQQHHHHQNQTQHHNEQVLFAGTAALGFDGSSSAAGWSEQQQHPEEHEHGRLHRMVAWNAAADTGTTGHGGAGAGGGGGFIFNAPSPMPASLFGHGQYLSQRGPLQSSNTPSIRAWMDPAIATATIADHHHHHYLSPAAIHQSSVYGGIGFAPSGGFSGFRIPTRIQGEEEHDGVSDKPSSASSDSRH